MFLAWWRHFRLQFFTDVHTLSSYFRRRWNGTELPFAVRMIFALFCRTVRMQIVSRREQYTTRNSRQRKREMFFGLGSEFSSREWHIRATLTAA